MHEGGCIPVSPLVISTSCSNGLGSVLHKLKSFSYIYGLQAVARTTSALPGGKCLAAAIDYEPPPVNLSLFDV